jgi:queuine/archaeosine tRNA-ribosyltransferase
MIINGNYYPQTAGNITEQTEQSAQLDSLASYMRETEQQGKSAADSVQLSKEAYTALKKQAPEALAALGYDDDNPVLEEMKEIAKERYFHFGSGYVSVPETEEEMLSALDVANRYMDALNAIEPDEIYEAIAGANSAGAESSGGDVQGLKSYIA